MKKYIGVLCIGLLALGCTKQDLVLDVKALANQSKREVHHLLGQPDSIYITPILHKKVYTELYFSEKYQVELLYSSDTTVNEIKVNNPVGLPFAPSALAKFGLPSDVKPTKQEENLTIIWNDLEGFKRVNIFTQRLDSTGKPEKYTIYFRVQ
ncbi:hypothetical protein AAG747_13165 [Rapidithrix thailandica]|uniref:Lipoprotein n=1 Tax=Rapidithrix thailandica TaxID=413964 RepID=A0AAW9S8V1_9BACT